MTGERERLALLAHELRSPVAALAALAQQARAGSLERALLLRLVDLALAAGRDVARLLSDPDLLSLRRTDVDLAELVRGLAAPGVEVVADAVPVSVDPTRVRQALANVVANARRHGTAVVVRVWREGDRAVVTVADDGPGVTAETDLFERGVSGDGSTGYGLWLAREIARAHGGELSLEAVPGPGATFRLVLPRASAGRG
jgi:signal transduction histidine kinase